VRNASAKTGGHVFAELGREHGPIDVGEQGVHPLDQAVCVGVAQPHGLRLEGGSHGLLAPERQAELVDVLLAHPVEEVQALRVVRRDAGDTEDAGDLLGETGAGRERMWAAAGLAGDEATCGTEVLEHGRDVGRGIHDPAPGLSSRVPVAGTRERHQPQTPLMGRTLHPAELPNRARSAMVEDERYAVLRSGHVHVEVSPVGQVDDRHDRERAA